MARNIKEIMVALDKILASTVWVNSMRQIISLADELSTSENDQVRAIEDLPRESLIGAFVSLQIRSDNFDQSAEGLDTPVLAQAVKNMVFAEAKKLLNAESAPERKIA